MFRWHVFQCLIDVFLPLSYQFYFCCCWTQCVFHCILITCLTAVFFLCVLFPVPIYRQHVDQLPSAPCHGRDQQARRLHPRRCARTGRWGLRSAFRVSSLCSPFLLFFHMVMGSLLDTPIQSLIENILFFVKKTLDLLLDLYMQCTCYNLLTRSLNLETSLIFCNI